MFSTLRARLLLSYVAIIVLILCGIGTALFLLLADNPLPDREATQRLLTISRTSYPLLRSADSITQLENRLTFIAEANNIRVLRVTPDSQVLFDTQSSLTGQTINLRLPERSPQNAARPRMFRAPDGQTWLFVPLTPDGGIPGRELVIFATPRPRAPALQLFGRNLLRPLLQAGLIALLLGIALAIGISNWVANPLRRVASTAKAIAQGDYSHRAPETGPREARSMARSFNEMVEQVQRTHQTQREFLANVSHDLKTPLTSIQGYSQAILDGTANDAGAAAQIIHDEAGRMHRLVEDLLDLARIESGQTPLRRDEVQIGAVLKAVVTNLTPQANKQSVTIQQQVGPSLRLTGDGDRIAQVFTNLIDNAVTHTPPGGQVMVTASKHNNGVRVTVHDEGPGIPADELPRIFERFYQVEKSRARSLHHGTGLGLTISKEIVEAHGGRIQVNSSPAEGTTFSVWLPRTPPSQTA